MLPCRSNSTSSGRNELRTSLQRRLSGADHGLDRRKETAAPEERPQIAGVRATLEIGHALQTDPTIIYGMVRL